MDERCGCGGPARGAFPGLGCLECGAPCCPTCAIHLESATYCRRCASLLLETTTIRAASPFDLC
ncbi:MAG: hypothetical protein A2W08_11915 [Candidatus Rokubacteria bacterium RBG_16_73_20]|nr:MAG: hypothetical protein A2050_01385 [Candidatus Rokubacteria bacterium GWA2_73_35]OGK93462.1 MAG: hypothetical protein A2W08_11915 [Candidatus Rokubacteria bacterium RBG_16_73_20]HBH01671.1 hypothetical protein [Candidatus Rokubacteria bacterium]